MKKPARTLAILLCALFCLNANYAQKNPSHEEFFKKIENYIYSAQRTQKQSRKYFSKIKRLAAANDSNAMFYQGLLQKDGIGTKQSFKKSRRSFKKAFDLGNEKAAYCLGYYTNYIL